MTNEQRELVERLRAALREDDHHECKAAYDAAIRRAEEAEVENVCARARIEKCESVNDALTVRIADLKFALTAERTRREALEAALRDISKGAKRYWREGEYSYQFAILADAALKEGT